jgi:hypothetical protein
MLELLGGEGMAGVITRAAALRVVRARSHGHCSKQFRFTQSRKA